MSVYDYRCTVTFADGTELVSEMAELTVNTYINITSHPNDQVVVLGYQYRCILTGMDGTEVLTDVAVLTVQ